MQRYNNFNNFTKNMEEDSNDLFHKIEYSQPNSGSYEGRYESNQKYYSKNENIAEELNNLSRAKDRFRCFLEELGDLKRTPIRSDIVTYCGEQKKSQKVIEHFSRTQVLMKKVDLRIEKYLFVDVE